MLVEHERSAVLVTAPPPPPRWGAADLALVTRLGDWFGTEFHVLCAESGDVLHTAQNQPVGDWSVRAALAKEISHRGRPEPMTEEGPLLVLGLPWERNGKVRVAMATFVTRRALAEEDLTGAAKRLGLNDAETRKWIDRQSIWPSETLCRVSRLAVERIEADQRAERLQVEVNSLSRNIASTYEEINLLYRLTQNLRISDNDEQLVQLALDWLAEALPVEGLAALLTPIVDEAVETQARSRHKLLTHGAFPLDADGFRRMLEATKPLQVERPMVINPPLTDEENWPFPGIRELIVVPLVEGDNLFGYLAAANHIDGLQLGTIEANLLASVACILGIHSGNIDLYRRRAELLTGVVRALTSAIEAKDPYTCGHSDRVARVALRLARQLGLDSDVQSTIYLSGLLHDIGKIGIDDTVLRKPGKLTKEEFEHIKLHPELGYKILIDLKELGQVLPVVLHHHENWDGLGYPTGLSGEKIPLLARIVAVADAFDAMGSDRPYRPGMEDEKLDAILRAGAGTQWDARVVAAFFAARDDIRDIARHERETLELDMKQWK
jgi:HD-GYP domain-containing protein (c-di-GMP phosphodiesterase class II)